ncbi:hypothetical protein ACRAWD_27070 [Caulobacter segnis]
MNTYSRVGFDLDANNEIYAAFNAARVESSNQPNPGAAYDWPDDVVHSDLVSPGVDRRGLRRERHYDLHLHGTSNALLPRNISGSPDADPVSPA